MASTQSGVLSASERKVDVRHDNGVVAILAFHHRATVTAFSLMYGKATVPRKSSTFRYFLYNNGWKKITTI